MELYAGKKKFCIDVKYKKDMRKANGNHINKYIYYN